MISYQDVLKVHSVLIETFGGSHGVRDEALLESALGRVYQTFDGVDLYTSSLEKAAAILESIVKNHPFVDGNKRTGYVIARLILMSDGKDIYADQEAKYQFVIDVSTNSINFDQIISWLKKYIK
jgi:death on curing protein